MTSMHTRQIALAALTTLIAVGGRITLRADTRDALDDAVRAATASFRDPNAAIAAGWVPQSSCVSGPQQGAMGVHFVNEALVADGKLDPERPEALVYEVRGSHARLVGVEFIVPVELWHAANPAPPALMGQLFHHVGSPNRYGAPPFYELHVWAWRLNPSGMFADWNPHVTCAEFPGQGE